MRVRGVAPFARRVALALLVALWTIPALGLAVSSLRERDRIITSGWWMFAVSGEKTGFVRTQAGSGTRQGALWLNEGYLPVPAQPILAWGVAANAPRAFAPGQRITLPDARALTVWQDGRYLLSAPSEGNDARGLRIFVTTKTAPRLTGETYRKVVTEEGMGRAFLTTLSVTVPATILPILIAAFGAYALAWMEFPGRSLMIIVLVGLLVVPLQLALIPMLKLHNQIGLGKGYIGVWLAHTAFGLPLAVYIARNAMRRLPRSVIESARMDGAGELQIFRHIALPLAFPALASFAVFQFLWVWNDLLVATVFLGSSAQQRVMTVMLREMMGSHGGAWDVLAASAFVSMAVPLAVYFVLQKALLRGLLAGVARDG